MLLRDSLNAAIHRLASSHVPSPRLNAETLLLFTLNCDRAYLYAHPERQLTPQEVERYDAALAERTRGVPAQYITGHQEFWGMDLIVSTAVLIPRPETEHLIEAVLARVSPPASHSDNHEIDSLRIIDVGTGSGCIALAVAKELPKAEIDATDVSSQALGVARINAARHQLEGRVRFHENDLLQGFPVESFDFVVSNPPYVGLSEEDQVQLEVRKFEPREAVFAGPTGLEVIARLVPQAEKVLKPGGWLIMEISGSIASKVKTLTRDWAVSDVLNDLQGIPRVVVARKRG